MYTAPFWVEGWRRNATSCGSDLRLRSTHLYHFGLISVFPHLLHGSTTDPHRLAAAHSLPAQRSPNSVGPPAAPVQYLHFYYVPRSMVAFLVVFFDPSATNWSLSVCSAFGSGTAAHQNVRLPIQVHPLPTPRLNSLLWHSSHPNVLLLLVEQRSVQHRLRWEERNASTS
eukprot:GGOE01026625.1.p1 GENE.GGOE01026625.1~~GGOE01026625.1.p1  ORF type:complete len:170 (-),score=15.94 GGOE01026625.1:150-659(-)